MEIHNYKFGTRNKEFININGTTYKMTYYGNFDAYKEENIISNVTEKLNKIINENIEIYNNLTYISEELTNEIGSEEIKKITLEGLDIEDFKIEDKSFCPHCGVKTNNTNFCPNCGLKL